MFVSASRYISFNVATGAAESLGTRSCRRGLVGSSSFRFDVSRPERLGHLLAKLTKKFSKSGAPACSGEALWAT
jgi:hypothetical protein